MGVVAPTPVTVEDCRWAVSDFHAGHIARKHLDAMRTEAILHRFQVECKLAKRWSWCDRNPGHDRAPEREQACIDTLAEYVNWSDVLHEINRALGRPEEWR